MNPDADEYICTQRRDVKSPCVSENPSGLFYMTLQYWIQSGMLLSQLNTFTYTEIREHTSTGNPDTHVIMSTGARKSDDKPPCARAKAPSLFYMTMRWNIKNVGPVVSPSIKHVCIHQKLCAHLLRESRCRRGHLHAKPRRRCERVRLHIVNDESQAAAHVVVLRPCTRENQETISKMPSGSRNLGFNYLVRVWGA